jgi:hypothetical protein
MSMARTIEASSPAQNDELNALNDAIDAGTVVPRSISFAQDLVRKGQQKPLSSKQMYWVRKLSEAPAEKPAPTGSEAPAFDGNALAQVVPYLPQKNQSFANDLARKSKWGLSEKQMFWAEKFLKEGTEAKAEGMKTIEERRIEAEKRRQEAIARREAERIATTPVSDADADSGWEAVLALFDAGARTLTRMQIHLMTDEGQRVLVRSNRRKGESNDVLYVHNHHAEKNDRRAHFGHINKVSALWNHTPATPETVKEVMEIFKADPVGTVSEMGRKSGVCCFCSLPLTDERSTAHGYGPVCAKNYALQWGTRSGRTIEQLIANDVREVIIETRVDSFDVVDKDSGEVIATFQNRYEAESFIKGEEDFSEITFEMPE